MDARIRQELDDIERRHDRIRAEEAHAIRDRYAGESMWTGLLLGSSGFALLLGVSPAEIGNAMMWIGGIYMISGGLARLATRIKHRKGV